MDEIERLQGQLAAAVVLLKLVLTSTPALHAAIRQALPDVRGLLLPLALTDDQLDECSRVIELVLAPLPSKP